MRTPPVINTQTTVETLENVWLTFRLAGPATRLGAATGSPLVRIINEYFNLKAAHLL